MDKNGNLKETEFKALSDFARANTFFDARTLKNQLRSLWTAYCIHWNLQVDTGSYDSDLIDLWSDNCLDMVPEWESFDDFDGFMCEFLV